MEKAFTLIELLVVIAIIAVLVIIALPNFSEARARSKTSRTKADMRTLAVGLENYRTDFNSFLLCNNYGLCGARISPDEQNDPVKNKEKRIMERLTTPVAYLTQSFLYDSNEPVGRRSTFTDSNPQGNYSEMTTDVNYPLYKFLKYHSMGKGREILSTVDAKEPPHPRAFVLSASGPTRTYANLGTLFSPSVSNKTILDQVYDPTNGTMSYGYIFRIGGEKFYDGYYAGNFLNVMEKHALQ